MPFIQAQNKAIARAEALRPNYTDSAKVLAESHLSEGLPPFYRELLDTTYRQVFFSQPSDTQLLYGIMTIAVHAINNPMARQFNELMGRFCSDKIETNATEEEKRLYREYLAAHLNIEATRLVQGNRFYEGLEKRYQALEQSKLVQDTFYMTEIMYGLYQDHFNATDYDQAEKWALEAIALEEARKNKEGIVYLKAQLASCMVQRGEYKEAIPFFEAKLALARQNQNNNEASSALNSLGFAHRKLKEYDKSIHYFEQCLEIYEQFGYYFGASNIHNQLANVAIEKGDWQKAKKHGLALYQISQENPSPQIQKNATNVMAKVYEHEGNYKKSMEMLRLYYQLRDSVTGEANTRALLDQRYKFQYREKAKLDSLQSAADLMIQVAENKRRKTTAYFLWSAIVVMILFAGILWHRFRITRQQKAMIEEEKVKLDQANEKLKALDNMKSSFITNISHELRTPVSLILGPISHLLRKISPKLEKEDRDVLQLVERNGTSLLGLVEELLDFSSLDASKLVLKKEPTAFYPFCRQLFSAFESMAEFKNIDYTFSFELPQSIYLDIDRSRLEKIINNLLSNALKFTHEGEVKLKVHGSKFYDQSSPPKTQNLELKTLTLTVSDTGRGIPPEDLPHVFDRYFQTKRTELSTEGGTGVGLSLARELALLMEGDLKVESEWGKGSTFTLWFQAQELPSPSKEAETVEEVADEEVLGAPLTPSESNGSRPKILIVEDNPDMQKMIYALLSADYNCIMANDGLGAWELLEQNHASIKDISLILSDIMMPRMDGYALLEKIKAHKIWSQTPMIMLTARAAEADKLTALRMGVDDYQLKPFSAPELEARVANLIANHKARVAFAVAESPVGAIDFGEAPAADTEWLQQLESAALEAIDKKLPLNASYLSGVMASSDRHLFRKIKQMTGLSPNQYIQEIKLQKARHFLENKTYHTIAEVAYASGFNTPNYFAKVFEKRFGKLPSAY